MSFTTRFAFALAAGLWIGFGGLALSGAVNPASAAGAVSKQKADAATPSDTRKRTSGRHAKTSAKPAATAAAATGAAAAVVTGAAAAAAVATGAATAATPPPELPDAIANAHAQMSDTRTDSAAAPLAATEQGSAEAEVVAADQLNELDRQASAATSAQHSATAVQPTASKATLWDQTSLIGKIFIAFGALLTAASAARLAIA